MSREQHRRRDEWMALLRDCLVWLLAHSPSLPDQHSNAAGQQSSTCLSLIGRSQISSNRSRRRHLSVGLWLAVRASVHARATIKIHGGGRSRPSGILHP
mmetsp:Transcript_15202/g.22298  ORF Transcript_15202/g.22298 Transcript_15202/m.22298 type:complete len:99 (-) Transcript_15202:675-971(-)